MAVTIKGCDRSSRGFCYWSTPWRPITVELVKRTANHLPRLRVSLLVRTVLMQLAKMLEGTFSFRNIGRRVYLWMFSYLPVRLCILDKSKYVAWTYVRVCFHYHRMLLFLALASWHGVNSANPKNQCQECVELANVIFWYRPIVIFSYERYAL